MRARRLILTIAMALLALAAVASTATAAQVESPTSQLQVWNVNTHGMDTGIGSPPNNSTDDRTDYRDFVTYITNSGRASFFPDVITLQETGTNITTPSVHTTTCNEFAYLVFARTGRGYLCDETTKRGGAAIVYRADRLQLLAVNKNVQLYTVGTKNDPSTGEVAGQCKLRDYYAMVMLFQDKKNPSKYMTVESVHLPKEQYGAQD